MIERKTLSDFSPRLSDLLLELYPNNKPETWFLEYDASVMRADEDWWDWWFNKAMGELMRLVQNGRIRKPTTPAWLKDFHDIVLLGRLTVFDHKDFEEELNFLLSQRC